MAIRFYTGPRGDSHRHTILKIAGHPEIFIPSPKLLHFEENLSFSIFRSMQAITAHYGSYKTILEYIEMAREEQEAYLAGEEFIDPETGEPITATEAAFNWHLYAEAFSDHFGEGFAENVLAPTYKQRMLEAAYRRGFSESEARSFQYPMVHVSPADISPRFMDYAARLPVVAGGAHTGPLVLDANNKASVHLRGSFNVVRPEALDYVRTRAGNLVQHITDTQKARLRAYTEDAIKTGHFTPQQLADKLRREVMPGLGLTDRDAGAVQNMARNLFNKNPQPGQPGYQHADVMYQRVNEYRDRLLMERAKTIAQTEVMAAQNYANQAGYSAAKDIGIIGDNAGKVWMIGPEGGSLKGVMVCPICMPMRHKKARVDEPFHTPDGPIDYPPLHPRCRCSTYLDPDAFALGEEPDEAPEVEPAKPTATGTKPTPKVNSNAAADDLNEKRLDKISPKDGNWEDIGQASGVNGAHHYVDHKTRTDFLVKDPTYGRDESVHEMEAARLLHGTPLLHQSVRPMKPTSHDGNGEIAILNASMDPRVRSVVGTGPIEQMMNRRLSNLTGETDFTPAQRRIYAEDATRMRAFDSVVHNADRHGGNYLSVYDHDGNPRLYAIDHSLIDPAGGYGGGGGPRPDYIDQTFTSADETRVRRQFLTEMKNNIPLVESLTTDQTIPVAVRDRIRADVSGLRRTLDKELQ